MEKSIALLFAASTLVLAGCHSVFQMTRTQDTSNLTDWGTVEFSENIPKYLNLGEGKRCTLTATLLANGNLQIAIKTEEKLANADARVGAQIQMPMPVEMTQTLIVPSGVETVSYVGHMLVRFTPKLKVDLRPAKPLDVGQANFLARQLANQKAQAPYKVQPFTGILPAASLVGERWPWRERAAFGHGDREANVSFAPDGSAPTVQVLLLD